MGLGAFFYSFFIVQGVHEIPASVIVQKEVMGLNTDTDALRFGSLKPGTGSSRFVKVVSKESSWVTIQVKGNLASWVWVSNESFFLNKGDMDEIRIKVDVPDSVEDGNYTGKVIFIFRQPWIGRLEMFK